MCVCCLTAALIRPLWVRLIGPVIRDAALPPSPARWITSHCRLLRFQDKWTEGESITPREGEGERDRGRDRIPYRDTDEDTEVGREGKCKKGKLKRKKKDRRREQWRKNESDKGRKTQQNEKRRYDGDSCGGLLLGQPPPLPPVPLTG